LAKISKINFLDGKINGLNWAIWHRATFVEEFERAYIKHFSYSGPLYVAKPKYPFIFS